VIGKLIDAFGNWLEHRREVRETRELEPSEFTAIARELSITPENLDTFVHNGPQAVGELRKLLKVLGIDETALARNQPPVLRDISASAPHANKSIGAAGTLETVPSPKISSSTALMRRRSTHWTESRKIEPCKVSNSGHGLALHWSGAVRSDLRASSDRD
jgi:hypothetical protein